MAYPTTKPGIRARIASYRRLLRQEFAEFGRYGDGYGKRWWLFHLYFLLGEEADVRAYLDWYARMFPDDGGEVGQRLCWALILRRFGREDEALYRFVQAIDENLPAVAKVVGDSQAPYGMWGEHEEMIRELYEVPSEVVQAITADERRWLVASWHSPAVAAMRHRTIAIGRALVTTTVREKRVALLNQQRALIQAFKPADMPPLSSDASKHSWLSGAPSSAQKRPRRKAALPTVGSSPAGSRSR
ncbi:MAG: hypothetical protein H0V44_06715 [Planctomycetes bacterium]|nr:hypothetical protein [Planctomycetota bacterium]